MCVCVCIINDSMIASSSAPDINAAVAFNVHSPNSYDNGITESVASFAHHELHRDDASRIWI